MATREAPTQTTVGLDVIKTGEVPMPPDYVFGGDGSRLKNVAGLLRDALLPGGELIAGACLAYVVRHPSAGTILIDTGFHPRAATDKRKEFGAVGSVVFRSLEIADEPYEDALRRLGVEPESEVRVVMTHLHGDHTSGMRLLPNATFVLARAEWEGATAPGAGREGFVAAHLPPQERTELVDFDRDGEPHGPFASTIDLLGDGSFRLVSTPGHTAGHLSVLLQADGGPVLVVGDAAYTLRSIREGVLPLLTHDAGDYRRSLDELRAFSDENPRAVIVPTHDPEAWKRLAEPAAAA